MDFSFFSLILPDERVWEKVFPSNDSSGGLSINGASGIFFFFNAGCPSVRAASLHMIHYFFGELRAGFRIIFGVKLSRARPAIHHPVLESPFEKFHYGVIQNVECFPDIRFYVCNKHALEFPGILPRIPGTHSKHE